MESTNEMIHIVVYGAPQGKGRPRMSKFGGVYTPAKTAAYESVVRFAAGQGMIGHSLFENPVGVKIRACFAVPESYTKKKKALAEQGRLFPAKKPDIDNIQKAVLDGCNKVVWKDDALIVKIEMTKEYSDKPRVEIDVYEMRGTDEKGQLCIL